MTTLTPLAWATIFRQAMWVLKEERDWPHIQGTTSPRYQPALNDPRQLKGGENPKPHCTLPTLDPWKQRIILATTDYESVYTERINVACWSQRWRNIKKIYKKEACELKLTTRKLRSLLRATDLTNQASKSTCMQQRKGKSSTAAEFTECGLLPPPQRMVLQN